MSKENRRKRGFFPLFLLSLSLGLAGTVLLASMQINFLYISPMHNGETVLFFPLVEGEEFMISYTHSVDLLPVREIYTITGENIYLKETHFHNFGAGLGLLEGRGNYLEEDGLLKVVEINEKIDPFILRTGIIADHHLCYRDRIFALNECFGAYNRLVFTAGRKQGLPLLKELLHCCKSKNRSDLKIFKGIGPSKIELFLRMNNHERKDFQT